MRLVLGTIALGVLIGYLAGGRLSNFGQLRIRWAGLALAGLALQFVAGPGTVIPMACLLGSFVLLSVFAVRNIRIAGFALILIGVFLNFTVIAVNLGMPVTRQALKASGQKEFLDDIKRNPYPKHHLASSDDVLVFLGDVIAVPKPISQAISIGDIFTYGGVGVVIMAGMLRPAGRRDEDETEDVADAKEVQRVGR